MTLPLIRQVQALLLASPEPLSLARLLELCEPAPGAGPLREAITALQREAESLPFELVAVAAGFRYQLRPAYTAQVHRLWQTRPPRHSRALLETLALIAYRQPVTRGEIEAVRGVAVSTSIMRTLLDEGWIRTAGRREAPGRPALYETTPAFLSDFNLCSLDQLPALAPTLDEAGEPALGRAPGPPPA